MHIKELMARTGVAERQIRYLIAEGFVPGPRGGRANADYGEDHVTAIERYLRLRKIGFPPAAIKLLLQAGAGAPFPVAPGITLVIEPDVLATPRDIEPLVERVREILSSIAKGPSHESTHDPS